MLKDLLKANGLALEGDELPVEPIEQIDESIEAVETQGEEIEQTQSDIESTEEAVQTLESLVLAFESAAGERTALEKHLFVAHASTLYAQMGLAKPAQVSLESADGVTLSMEGFKETAKKVWEAIKAAWNKMVAMVKDLWAKIGDTAGRLHKKLAAKLKETTKTEVSFKCKVIPLGYETTVDVNDSNFDRFADKALVKAMIEFSEHGSRQIIEHVRKGDNDSLKAMLEKLGEGDMLARFGAEGTFNITVQKSGMKLLGYLNQVSKYHRDWAGRNARKDALLKECVEAALELNKNVPEESKTSEWLARLVARLVMKTASVEERLFSALSKEVVTVSKAFIEAL